VVKVYWVLPLCSRYNNLGKALLRARAFAARVQANAILPLDVNVPLAQRLGPLIRLLLRVALQVLPRERYGTI